MHDAGHIQRDSSGVLVDIRVSSNSYPCIHDWNEDGMKDLIIGEIENVLPDTGNIRIYLNSGTNASPAFRDYQLMHADSGHLNIIHAHPEIFDLDGDSLKDLVCGNENGFIYFFKNNNTNQSPYFEAEYETLMTVDSLFIDGYTNSRIHLCDWTDDGDLDIILGGQDGYVWVCENGMNSGIRKRAVEPVPGCSFQSINNPVTTTALFSVTLQEKTDASLTIYSITGAYVDEIVFAYVHPGTIALQWCPPDYLCSGVYFAILKTCGFCAVEKILLVR